jgi:hypothetical protein
MLGLKKAARGTSDAGFNTAKLLVEKVKDLMEYNSHVHVKLNGFGPGRYNECSSYSL